MTSYTRCVIGGVDYGPLGLNLLVRANGLSVNPSGDSSVGTGRVRLYQDGGGADIVNQMYAEIDEFDAATNRVTWRHFCGFVNRRGTGRLTGTNTKTWDIDFQDVNLELYALVTRADWGGAIHIPAGGFVAQVAAVFAHFFTGLATRSIDATSYVADLIPGHTLAAATYQGQDAISMLQDIFTRAQAINPDLRPTAMITPDPLVPGIAGAGFGPPVLQVFDAAAPLVVEARFSDVPDGTHHAILVAPEFKRIVESSKLVQWQQAIDEATGTIYTGTDPASIALYGNPFDKDNAWKAKPVKIPKDLATFGARLAWINRRVLSKSRPRETLAFATFTPVRPGAIVAVTWSLDGLSEQVYVVASVTVNFAIPRRPVYVVQLGARLLRLGDKDSDPIYALPHEGDTTAPDPPSSLALASNAFNWTTLQTDLGFTWVAPGQADLDPDEPYTLEVKVNGVVVGRWIGAALAATIAVAPGATWAATLTAKDTSGNVSAPAELATPAAVGVPVPSKPTWPSGTDWILENTYDAATQTTRVVVTWDANDPSEHVTRYRVRVDDDPGNARLFPVDDGTTVLTLPNESPNVLRIFKVTAYNEAGRASLISDPVSLITAEAPPPVAPTLPPNGSFEVGTTDSAALAKGWIYSHASTGQALRTVAGGATDGKWATQLTQVGSNWGAALSTLFGAEAGTPYRCALTYKAASGVSDPSFIIQIDGYDKTSAFVSTITTYTVGPVSAGSAWAKFVDTFTVPAGTITQMRVYLKSTGAGTIYIDNVQIAPQVGTSDLIDGGVTSDKIAPGAVTNAALEYGSPVAQAGPTAGRPASPVVGQTYFDTDLSIPIWWQGTTWVDATGSAA